MCLQPNTAWEVSDCKTGEVSITFKMGLPGFLCLRELKLPCGKCLECKMKSANVWATRIMHEAQMFEDNCVITLTYDQDHLPTNGSLKKSDFQGFLKRLRARFLDRRIKYFYCGEYGELLERPHYHGCLFNFDFQDKYYWRKEREKTYYRSPLLEKLWEKGISEIGDVCRESAAYIARYVTKKIKGKESRNHYGVKKPEYINMSTGREPGGGIGGTWLKKFESDVYPSDEVIVNERAITPPRYYDKQLALSNPGLLQELKAKRVDRALIHAKDQTLSRRKARLECLKSRYKLLKRRFENGPV